MLDRLLALEKEFDEAARALTPLDAGVWLGLPHSAFIGFETADELAKQLAASAVTRAVISHTAGWLLDATLGNDCMTEALAILPRCVGAMTLLPEGAEHFGKLEPYLVQQLGRGLRVARIFPKAHRYTLRVPAAAEMFRILELYRVPLMIQIGQSNIDELAGIARNHPRLNIIIDSTGHHEFLNMRGVLGQLEATPNLLVTTRGQFMCGGIELLHNRLGAERIVFASNFPIDQLEAGLSLLINSFLPDEDKHKIAHQNMERLLDGIHLEVTA